MKKSIRIFLALVAGLFFSSPVWASACVPETGEWAQIKKSPTQDELSGLRRLRFYGPKIISGPRGIIGDSRLGGTYALKITRNNQNWLFQFQQSGNVAGSLTLHLPAAWTFFQAQTQAPEGDDAVMYKEIRLEGRLAGAGLFAGPPTPVSYRLILQGRGGRCFEPGQLTRWVLQVHGPDPQNPLSGRNVLYYWLLGHLSS